MGRDLPNAFGLKGCPPAEHARHGPTCSLCARSGPRAAPLRRRGRRRVATARTLGVAGHHRVLACSAVLNAAAICGSSAAVRVIVAARGRRVLGIQANPVVLSAMRAIDIVVARIADQRTGRWIPKTRRPRAATITPNAPRDPQMAAALRTALQAKASAGDRPRQCVRKRARLTPFGPRVRRSRRLPGGPTRASGASTSAVPRRARRGAALQPKRLRSRPLLRCIWRQA